VEAGIFFSLQRGSFLLELGSASYRLKNNYLGEFSFLFLFSNESFSNFCKKNPGSESRLKSKSPANSPDPQTEFK
jgi:hypothetical protein